MKKEYVSPLMGSQSFINGNAIMAPSDYYATPEGQPGTVDTSKKL